MEGDLMYMTQSAPELYGVRVVKYIRCSHDDQVLHGDTLEAQNEILDDFIAHRRSTDRPEEIHEPEGIRPAP